MGKVALIIIGVLVVAVLLMVGLFIAPFVYDGFRSSSQRRALQRRSDYSQIATACVAIARTITNDSSLIKPTDPIVPTLIRSLSPRYISASSNHVTMEFHGGFDHYGYRVRQSDTNATQWTISWYTEQGERLLTTISHD
jgi:hypothetical protein